MDPEGFAHGFLTLSENASICYKVTNFGTKDLEHSLLWDDEEISINWPININDDLNFIISQKDQEAMTLNQLIVSGNLFI